MTACICLPRALRIVRLPSARGNKHNTHKINPDCSNTCTVAQRSAKRPFTKLRWTFVVRASSEAVADLVVVLEQLYDDLDVGVVVLDGDDAQDVGRILRIRLLAVLVGEHQASVRLFHLHAHTHTDKLVTMVSNVLVLLAPPGKYD